jgi:dTDP-4-dehydrorhamnose reductase
VKVLVVGCNGLLGQNLLRTADFKKFEVEGLGLQSEAALPHLLTGYQAADIGVREALLGAVEKSRPDFIVNAAAITDVDGCERNPDLCNRINRDVVGWMASTGIPLAQISTDYVFDGTAGPYGEEAPTHPLSHYGRAKLESESLALSGSPRSLVVRTLLLWGIAGVGKGSKKSFTDFVQESLTVGKSIRIVTDQIGNPTLAHDLAEALWALISGGHSGLYHAAGSDCMSRYDWAREVADFYGLDASLIQTALTADLHQDAARPLRSGLRCEKLARDTGYRLRGLRAQLEWCREVTETLQETSKA